MTLLEEVKAVLRVKTTAFDDSEITPLIDACKIDLRLAGVNKIDDSDASIRRAICLYCKGNFGYSDNSEKFVKAYQMLRDSMALSGDYLEVANE